MTNEIALQIIIAYGLSIRQIPAVITSACKEADYVKHYAATTYNAKKQCVLLPKNYNFAAYLRNADEYKLHHVYEFDHVNKRIYKNVVVYNKIPKYAGYWMCQKVYDTTSTVHWDIKTHNLAFSLAASVEKWCVSNNIPY